MRPLWLAAAAALAFGAPPAFAEPSLTILPLTFAATEFRGPGTRVASVVASMDGLREDKSLADRPLVVVWGRTGGAALVADGAAIRIVRLRGGPNDLATAERTRDAIPSSRIAASGPLTVALTRPTREYPHEALGSTVQAKALAIAERRPLRPSADAVRVPVEASLVEAGPDAVFEDREPRVARLGRDGALSVVTVKSYAGRGSALAIVGRRAGTWQVTAETPPIGEAARWLNPAAVADFLGAGSPQIALVRTPHLDGILQLWRLEGDKLALVAEKAGYSNHAFGQAAQDLAATLDIDRDGRPELALPTLDRRSLAILSMADGIREIVRVDLPARAATGVAALGVAPDLHILVGLEDGRVVDIRP